MRVAHKPFVLLLLALPAGAAADTIVLRDGTRLDGVEITEATYEQVSFRLRGSLQRRDADDVAALRKDGGRYLDSALGLWERGQDLERAERYFQQTVDGIRGEEWSPPYAAYHLGEFYESQGNQRMAVIAYLKVEEVDQNHFYAPQALWRAAQIYLAADREANAVEIYDRLSGGEFGPKWATRGKYGKARLLLSAGDVAEAKRTFSDIARRARNDLQHLAQAGEAHCQLREGDTREARESFERIVDTPDAPGPARGWAWKGMGDCLEGTDADAAMLAYLRSYLLYPSNPGASAAALGAAKVSEAEGWGAEQRLRALARSPGRLRDYAGDTPSAELMRRCLQNVSANLVERFVPQLLAEAPSEEHAELEFTAADALKAKARAANDPALLAEYEARLKELQRKYPDHGRAALAGIDTFIAAKDRALALIKQAKSEPDAEKAERLMSDGQSLFREVLEPFQETIEAMTEEVDALIEKEIRSEDGLTPQEEQKKHETEFQRDLAEFLLAESYRSYAETFDEGTDQRADALKNALDAYDHYINMRGNYIQFLFNAYVGRGETLLAMGNYDEAIMQFEELSYVEAPYMPQEPEARKKMEDLIRDISIRAYYGWTRALNLAGKGAEAYEASQRIDDNPKAAGWEDHDMGILLKFERAKALAGAGRGRQGAETLYRIVVEAKQVPESEKIGALGMSRIGAGACRALSELSDQTGGEIYSPEIQYHVGIGYFLRRRQDLAIAGFKGVLVSAQTDEERREWVPKAVKQIGNLLFQQERYLEAALAYETVFTEFPQHEDAREAVRFALSAGKRAVEQFGEDIEDDGAAIVAFYRKIERRAVESDESKGAQIIMNQAADLQKNQRWEAAAEKYLEVPSEVEGEPVRFYANAIANAGYCFFQAYRASEDDRHLTRARESLQRAGQLAAESGDKDAQSLASYYLGQLENQLDRPREALAALEPFDGPLVNTTRYLVRARYEQALAHFALDDYGAAERDYAKVKDRTSDPYFDRFAYQMARAMRSKASEVIRADSGAIDQTRSLRRKAARYMRDWFDNTDRGSLRTAHYWWAGSVLFGGGQYRAAASCYEDGLERFPRPEVTGTGGEEEAEEQDSYDTAEMQLAYALTMLERYEEALTLLDRLEDTVVITDMRGNLIARGRFEGRELSDRKFERTRGGRTVREQRWFTIIELGGEEVRFFDTGEPRGANAEFQGVQGADPTASFNPGDERKLKLALKREFYVADARARATWGRYQEEPDGNFLVNDVTEACNELRFVLRGMSETYYQRLVAMTQIEPPTLGERRWEADLQYLRIKLAREQWAEVLSDLNQMDLLGRTKSAPPDVQRQLKEIRAEAEERQ